MREKLLELMKNEGLKSSQLAEMLGINPAGISHILAGRNKPGFDLLQKILRRFPRISPDWLLLDQGPMYRNDAPGVSAASPVPQTDRMTDGLFGQAAAQSVNASAAPTESERSGWPEIPAKSGSNIGTVDKSDAQVERVIIFYSDRTCESYTPAKDER